MRNGTEDKPLEGRTFFQSILKIMRVGVLTPSAGQVYIPCLPTFIQSPNSRGFPVFRDLVQGNPFCQYKEMKFSDLHIFMDFHVVPSTSCCPLCGHPLGELADNTPQQERRASAMEIDRLSNCGSVIY